MVFLKALGWIVISVFTWLLVCLPFTSSMNQMLETGERPMIDSRVVEIWNLSSLIFSGIFATAAVNAKEIRSMPRKVHYLLMSILLGIWLVILVAGWFIFYRV